MFDPELVLAHDISPTELTPLPVNSKLLLAAVSCYMVINLRNLISKSTFLADPKEVLHITFFQEMLGKIPEINEAVARLTVSQNLAF